MRTNLFSKDKKGSLPAVHLLGTAFHWGNEVFLWDFVHVAVQRRAQNWAVTTCCLEDAAVTSFEPKPYRGKWRSDKRVHCSKDGGQLFTIVT